MIIKKIHKKIFSYILISALCTAPLNIIVFPKTAKAEVYMTTSDNKLHYTLNADGSVAIRGMPYETITDESVAIPESINGKKVTSIGDMAFAHRDYPFKEIIIPSSVISIGRSAFSGNKSLESITLPDTINEIGEYAFYECGNLKSVKTDGTGATSGTGGTGIGKLSFGSCTSLENVSIPASVNYIGTDAFDRCESLNSVSIPDSVQGIGEMAFYFCKSLKTISIPGTAKTIEKSAFLSCSSLESAIFGDGVESIGGYAFCGCENLKNVTMPDTVSYIGTSAYNGCEKLVDISLPSSLKNINESVFYGCKSLKNIDIPIGATSIGKEAFSYCHALEGVNIPDTVTEIGEDAFFLCPPLVIYTPSGSYAETYAYEHNIKLYVTGLDSIQSPAPAETSTPPQAAHTPVPTSTPVITQTPAPTSTPVITWTPVPASTPVITRTPVPASTPVITQTSAPVTTRTPVPAAAPGVTQQPGLNNAYSFLDTSSSSKIADSSGTFFNNAVFVETLGTGSFTATVKEASWLSLSDKNTFSFANGKPAITLNGDRNFYLAVSKNNGSKRSAIISIVHQNQNLVKEITVTQMGKDDSYLYTDIDALYFDEPSAGYSDNFSILADENTVWTASSSKSWIKIVKDTSSKKYSYVEGTGNCGMRIFVKENNARDKYGSFIDRSGYVNINAGKAGKCKIYIHQAENEKSVKQMMRELSVSITKKNIEKGHTAKIKLDYPDGMYASDICKVSFSSNKKKVATVSNKGIVKGIKKGKAVIKVKVTAKDMDYGLISKSFKIKVTIGKRKVDLSKFKNSKKRLVN